MIIITFVGIDHPRHHIHGHFNFQLLQNSVNFSQHKLFRMNSELAKPVSRKDFGQINVTNLNKHFSLRFAKNLQVGVPIAQAGPVVCMCSEPKVTKITKMARWNQQSDVHSDF